MTKMCITAQAKYLDHRLYFERVHKEAWLYLPSSWHAYNFLKMMIYLVNLTHSLQYMVHFHYNWQINCPVSILFLKLMEFIGVWTYILYTKRKHKLKFPGYCRNCLLQC